MNHRWWGVVVVVGVGLSGCVDEALTTCADGSVCGGDSVCLPAGGCASAAQLAACAGAADLSPCDIPGVANGVCRDGACQAPRCGDGFVDATNGEACDAGAANDLTPDAACRPDCQPRRCGDGILDALAGEVCDDGNLTSVDGCAGDCQSDETCGNGRFDVQVGEGCDDGNLTPGDGCQPDCAPSRCGDGIVDDFASAQEACDDGNATSGDGCRADCGSVETCGNGVVDFAVGEECDDGGTGSRDGCSAGCAIEGVRWTRLDVAATPSAVGAPAMAWDALRQELVMFGGRRADNTDSDETWLLRAGGWVRPQVEVRPAGRHGAAMAYDAARGRVVLYGGSSYGSFNDTWLWDGTGWTLALPVHSPGPRWQASMAYDGATQQVVLFGGGTNTRGRGTWLWDGVDWHESSGDTPPLRYAGAMAYDPARGEILLVGGAEGGHDQQLAAPLADTWVWNGTSWRDVTPANAPPASFGHALAFAVDTQQIMMVGGAAGDQVWTWDGATWSVHAPLPGGLSPRHLFAMAPRGNGLVLFGGRALADDAPLGDTWLAAGTTWSPLVGAASPPARAMAASAYDPLRGRMVLFGGEQALAGTTTRLDDTWEWDGATWWQRSPAVHPAARGQSAMTYDSFRRHAVLFGGRDAADQDLNETWAWDGETWSQLLPGASPPPRADPGFAFDRARGVAVLFGGYHQGFLGDLWEWNGATWLERAPQQPTPGPRAGASLGYDAVRAQTVLFGGGDGLNVLDETWLWDGTTWTEGPASPRPPPRQSAQLTWSAPRQRLTLFGAGTDVWEWDGFVWGALNPNVGPGLSLRPAFEFDAVRGEIVLFGGLINPSVSSEASIAEHWTLAFGAGDVEACTSGRDLDHDGVSGCADDDCWPICTPLCPPGVSCAIADPSCGDGACDPVESCGGCAIDCGVCSPACGDATCQAAEDAAACPGDCPVP